MISRPRIGSITLSNPLILAPMAGITDSPFRRIVAEFGCGLFYTEMISAHALVHGNQKTLRLLESTPAEHPLTAQIFGREPQMLAEAARLAVAAGADLVDLNLGCSVPKVIKAGAGAALARDPEGLKPILRAMVQAVEVPVTIKIRSGWNSREITAGEITTIAKEVGVAAVAIHPRTSRQGYSGSADWSLAASLAKDAGLPIIGSGDIRDGEQARIRLEESGCAAVMIGRAAIGAPWIFQAARAALAGESWQPPRPVMRMEILCRHLDLLLKFWGQERGFVRTRPLAACYSRGLPGSAAFREHVFSSHSPPELDR